LKDYKTKVILKLTKPQGTICKKDYGNIGRKSAVTYAHYKFKNNYTGIGKVIYTLKLLESSNVI